MSTSSDSSYQELGDDKPTPMLPFIEHLDNMALKTHQAAMDFDAGYVNDLHLEKGVFLLINDNEIEASWLEAVALQPNFWITQSTYSYDMQSRDETSHTYATLSSDLRRMQRNNVEPYQSICSQYVIVLL